MLSSIILDYKIQDMKNAGSKIKYMYKIAYDVLGSFLKNSRIYILLYKPAKQNQKNKK